MAPERLEPQAFLTITKRPYPNIFLALYRQLRPTFLRFQDQKNGGSPGAPLGEFLP